MIKGINHSMIELHDTGNEYYERAILIIKPEYASVQRAILEDEAKKMLKELDIPSVMKIKSGKFKTIFMLFCSAAAGGLLTALFCLLGN